MAPADRAQNTRLLQNIHVDSFRHIQPDMLFPDLLDIQSHGSAEGGFFGDAELGAEHESVAVQVAE